MIIAGFCLAAAFHPWDRRVAFSQQLGGLITVIYFFAANAQRVFPVHGTAAHRIDIKGVL